MVKMLKKRIKLLNQNHEINFEEKKMFNKNIKNFYTINNPLFIESKHKSYKEMLRYSKIFGKINKDNYYEYNESTSQILNLGYNSQLSQIQKITEIRENILKKSNTLKSKTLLQLIPLIWSIISLIIAIIFYILFLYFLNEMKDIRFFHSIIIIFQIRIT